MRVGVRVTGFLIVFFLGGRFREQGGLGVYFVSPVLCWVLEGSLTFSRVVDGFALRFDGLWGVGCGVALGSGGGCYIVLTNKGNQEL